LTFCRSCGKELPQDAGFCPSCGAPVSVASPTPFRTQKAFDVGAKPRVVVASFVPGKIEARAGAAGKVNVDLDLRRAEDMDWSAYQQGDLIMVTLRSTSRTYWSWAAHPDSGPSADVSLTVPADCDLDIENKLDSVSIAGISGTLLVNSAVASVRASDCRGNLKVRTKTGSVVIEGFDGTASAETATGQVRFSGSLGRAESFFRTSVGAIEISLKGEPDLMVEARSAIGSVVSSLPLLDLRGEERRIYGRLGAGTGRLRVETSTGNIRLGP
jgi:Toastrack DUF4097/zinc-ribbon domain